MIKVSIILPSLNVADYIEQCLDSVVNQSLKEIEIICVDAGSTDGTFEIIEKFAANDERITVIKSDKKSYGYQMNLGINQAKGKYIGIVETDDFVPSNMYEELFEIAEKNNLEVLKADFYRFTVNENNEITKYLNKLSKNHNYYNKVLIPSQNQEVFSFIMNTWSGIYLRDFLVKNDIKHNETLGASFQDTGFWFQTLSLAQRAMFIDTPYYMNRRDNPNSSVYNKSKVYAFKDEYDFLQDFLERNPNLKPDILPVYQYYRYKGYMSSLNRSGEENRLDFIKQFAEDFIQSKNKGELDLTAFTEGAKKTISQIMESPEKFYQKYNKERQNQSVNYNLGTLSKEYTMTHNPNDNYKISVIIPVYNAEKYLAECLNSILSQTLKEIEIICIDDGSNDSSLNILDDFANKDERIIIRTQENQGSGIARNYAMELAVGEFIAFMDADDWYPEPDILETLYNKAVENKVKICGGSFSNSKNGVITTKFTGEYKKYTFKQDELINFSDYQFDYGYHRFIYNRQLLKDNNINFPAYKRFQDPVFFLKAMVLAQQFFAISKIVYCYRKDDNKVKWNSEKINDLLKGIRDNLIISKTNNLPHLHKISIDHLNNEFCNPICDFANSSNKEIFDLLFEITYAIDKNMLIEQGFDIDPNKIYWIKPLRKILFAPKINSIDLMLKLPSGTSKKLLVNLENFKIKELENNDNSQIVVDNSQIINLENKIKKIKNSASWKIGRFLTYIPRMIGRSFRK